MPGLNIGDPAYPPVSERVLSQNALQSGCIGVKDVTPVCVCGCLSKMAANCDVHVHKFAKYESNV